MNVSAEIADLSRTVDQGVLGRRIKAARVAAGLTQAQLAMPEASTAYLSRIESGDRRPDLKLLIRFAEKANVSLEQLVIGVTHDQRTELRLNIDTAAALIATGDVAKALALLSQVRKALAESPTSDLWPDINILTASAHRANGNIDDAIIALEDQTKAGVTAHEWLRASILLTRCYLESEDPNRCIETGEAILGVLEHRGLGQSPEAAEVAIAVASAHHGRGDHQRALDVARAALATKSKSSSEVGREYLAASAAEAGGTNLTLAASYAQLARNEVGRAAASAMSAHFHAQYGELLLDGDDPDLGAAREQLETAARLDTADGQQAARVQVALARVLLAQGDLEAAANALPFEEQVAGTPVLHATMLLVRGQLQRRNRRAKASRESLAGAVSVLKKAGADRATAQVWFELGATFDEVGDKDASGEAYRQAARATGLSRPASKKQAQKSVRS